MAQRIESFAALFPHGATTTVAITFSRVSLVDSVEILVPDGNNGKLAFSLAQANQQLIPPNPGGTIIANGETIKWPLEGFVSNVQWSITGNNQGSFDHTLYLRFLLREPTPVNPAVTPTFTPATPPLGL